MIKKKNTKVINSSQKRIHMSTISTDCHRLAALWRIACLFSLSAPFFFFYAAWGGRCVSWRPHTPGLLLLLLLFLCIISAGPRWGPFTILIHEAMAESRGWGLCSHELWLLHRLLVCGGVPWGVAGNVRSGRPHRGLHGGRRAPDRCHRGRAARQSAAGG